MNNASWRNVESHPPFHHLLEVMKLETLRSRRLAARAEEGAENVAIVREQNRQVSDMEPKMVAWYRTYNNAQLSNFVFFLCSDANKNCVASLPRSSAPRCISFTFLSCQWVIGWLVGWIVIFLIFIYTLMQPHPNHVQNHSDLLAVLTFPPGIQTGNFIY